MTTVAYRAGVLASDTQMTDGSIKSAGRKVIYVPEKEAWVGVAGTVSDAQKFLRWFGEDEDLTEDDFDKDEDDFVALVMFDDGRVRVYTPDLRYDELESDQFYAIGSGGPSALAAMHMGADARRAVEVACLVDLNSGGDVAMVKAGGRALRKMKIRRVPQRRR